MLRRVLSQHPPSALNRAYWEMLSPYKTKKRRDTSSSLPLFITGARNQRPPAWTVEVTAIRASSRAQEEQISRFKPRNTSLHREPISLTVHVDCSCLQDGFGLSPSRSTSLGGSQSGASKLLASKSSLGCVHHGQAVKQTSML